MGKMPKFNETDRTAVIRVVEAELGIRLKPVGQRKKWLRDDQGRTFWVLGGTDDWHGIPEDMMDAEAVRHTSGSLVVARLSRGSLQIFIGALGPIVKGRAKLSRARRTSGDYQFTVRTRANRMYISHVSGGTLRQLARVDYAPTEGREEKRVQYVRDQFARLSAEERQELLEELGLA